jgi:hypothetical protein
MDDAPDQIAETALDIKIKPGIMYAPHPAFGTPKATSSITT